MADHLWYAAYGSNLNRHRFSKYLGIDVGAPTYPQDHWLVAVGAVYMAGYAERWGGAVAFFDPTAGTAMMRRYRLSIDQFLALWSGENRGADLPPTPRVVQMLDAATSAQPDVCPGVDGLYDRARLVDTIDGDPVFTITTSKTIDRGPASDSYLDVIREGLHESPTTAAFRTAYLAAMNTD